MNFIIKMRALIRKFIARFFHFMASLIDLLKGLLRLLSRNFAPNLHCWTLNHQHVYAEWVAISASVNDDHQLSIRRRLQPLGPCYSNTWKIFRKDLDVKLFKIQLLQELKPNYLPKTFCSAHFWFNKNIKI